MHEVRVGGLGLPSAEQVWRSIMWETSWVRALRGEGGRVSLFDICFDFGFGMREGG